MSLKSTIILLDTMVVAGIFAVTKKHEKIEQHKAEWKRAIKSIISEIANPYLRVPTPVCFELMCWNKEWRNFILNDKRKIFQFAYYPVTNDVIMTATEYAVNCQMEFFDGAVHKVKTVDPLIAAYSLLGGHYILTENQQDFPESYFKIVKCEILLLDQRKGGLNRRVLYLLKPKQV